MIAVSSSPTVRNCTSNLQYSEGGQVTSEADLASTITTSAITTPAHGLVEGDSLFIGFDCPQYPLAVAVQNEILQSKRNQCLADSSSPVWWIDCDAIELSELGVYWVSAGADADESDDRTRMFGDPPAVWNRLCKGVTLASDKVGRYGPIGLRHQFAISGVPRIDVYPSYGLGVSQSRRSDGGQWFRGRVRDHLDFVDVPR